MQRLGRMSTEADPTQLANLAALRVTLPAHRPRPVLGAERSRRSGEQPVQLVLAQVLAHVASPFRALLGRREPECCVPSGLLPRLPRNKPEGNTRQIGISARIAANC
jgi:hypothetical protein